jgi:hypothetical protein
MTDRLGAYQLIKSKLQTLVWPGGQKVFGTVVVSPIPTEWVLHTNRVPAAIIRPGSSQVDPWAGEEPNLIQETFDLTLLIVVEGDRLAEHAMLGGPGQGLGVSAGKGLLEIERETLRAIRYLTAADLEIHHRASTAAQANLVEDLGYAVWRTHTFEMILESVADAPFQSGGST